MKARATYGRNSIKYRRRFYSTTDQQAFLASFFLEIHFRELKAGRVAINLCPDCHNSRDRMTPVSQ
jgi:hypothetical protein